MTEGLNPAKAQLVHEAKIQAERYAATYGVIGQVRNGSTGQLEINIAQDADFLMESISIAAYGPVNADGTPIGTGATAGETAVTDYPTFGVATAASRGLVMRISDEGSGITLTDGEIPVELIGTPGYGQQLFATFKMKYLLKKRSKLRFEIRNRDSAVTTPNSMDQYHSIEIALNGNKYR